MSGSGGVFKRCGCRHPQTGRTLDSACPQLSERGHGSWYFDCPVATVGGRRERVRRGGYLTRRDATTARDALLNRSAEDRGLEAWTVGRWLRYWLTTRTSIRPSTLRSYTEHVELHLIPHLGRVRLGELRLGGSDGHTWPHSDGLKWPHSIGRPDALPVTVSNGYGGYWPGGSYWRERREMHTIEIRDTTLYYESAGDGTPLLFIHGMCGDAEVWRGQVRRLADRFRCITYDRRGHTRSAMGDEAESVPTHAEDAAALIIALGVRPIVVGSSGGARIAVELSRRHPDLLAGAVFSEPPIFSLDQSAGNALAAELGAVVGPVAASEGPRAAVDAFFALMCPGLWSALDEAAKDRYRANAHMMLAEFGGPRYDLAVDDLSAVTVPALVIAGTTSLPALQSIARVLARGLPNARFVELPGSGHVTYAERPDEFARAVATFATEVQPPTLT